MKTFLLSLLGFSLGLIFGWANGQLSHKHKESISINPHSPACIWEAGNEGFDDYPAPSTVVIICDVPFTQALPLVRHMEPEWRLMAESD